MRGFRCTDTEVPGVLLPWFVDRVFVGLIPCIFRVFTNLAIVFAGLYSCSDSSV